MKAIKFSNQAVNAQAGRATSLKKGARSSHKRSYYPVMVELEHLLEMTHTILHEEAIIDRIRTAESEDPSSIPGNGIFWQVRDDGTFMLLDERSLQQYRPIFEEYLDPVLIANLTKFLEETNRKRLSEYQAAAESDQSEFGKIKVVKLG